MLVSSEKTASAPTLVPSTGELWLQNNGLENSEQTATRFEELGLLGRVVDPGGIDKALSHSEEQIRRYGGN